MLLTATYMYRTLNRNHSIPFHPISQSFSHSKAHLASFICLPPRLHSLSTNNLIVCPQPRIRSTVREHALLNPPRGHRSLRSRFRPKLFHRPQCLQSAHRRLHLHHRRQPRDARLDAHNPRHRNVAAPLRQRGSPEPRHNRRM